jgi:hypothetical protein
MNDIVTALQIRAAMTAGNPDAFIYGGDWFLVLLFFVIVMLGILIFTDLL